MRIVHVCRQYKPGVGGLESFLSSLVAQQKKAGHVVRIVTLDRIFASSNDRLPAKEDIDGVEVVRIGYFGSHRYPIAPAVLRHIGDANIVHVHAVDFFADFLALTRFLHRRPLVISTHGGFFHTGFASRLKKIWFHSITRWSLRAFKAVIACSDNDAALFRPLCARKLATVENGVDLAKFAPGASAEGQVMISFGRIAPNKQHGRLLRWFAAVWRLDPRWRLVIAGKPMGTQLSELEDVVRAEGIVDAVTIAPSPADSELSDLVSNSNLFVSTSSHEGFGLAAVEAASAGLDLVLSDIPPHRRTCERLGSGTLLDFEAPDAPARFVKHWKDRQSKPRKAPPPGLDSFGWPLAARAIEDVYHDALGERRRMIGAVAVDVMDDRSAIARVSGFIRRREPRVVAFCNAHMANIARKDRSFAAALSATVVLNDGIGVDIASRLCYGSSFPSNLNGTDFVPSLLAAQRSTTRVFLLGAAPGVAAAAGRKLTASYPNIVIVGAEHGFFDRQEEPALASRIAAARPDLILVAMGNPRQEIWAARWAGTIGAPVICVGALFDFLAGVIRRAPRLVRNARLEWAYRLVQEPGRLAERYLIGNMTFLLATLDDAWRGPSLSRALPTPLPVTGAADVA